MLSTKLIILIHIRREIKNLPYGKSSWPHKKSSWPYKKSNWPYKKSSWPYKKSSKPYKKSSWLYKKSNWPYQNYTGSQKYRGNVIYWLVRRPINKPMKPDIFIISLARVMVVISLAAAASLKSEASALTDRNVFSQQTSILLKKP